MEQRKINLCLISIKKETVAKLRSFLQANLQIYRALNVGEAISILRSRITDCIIAGISEESPVTQAKLSALTTRFPAIPVIGVIEESYSGKEFSIDLACCCGRIGVNRIVPAGNPEKLAEAIRFVLIERNLRGGGDRNWFRSKQMFPAG